MVLGIDISTSITGFAIVADEQIVYYDSIDLRKYKDMFDKTVAIKERLLDLFEMYQCNNDDSMRLGNSAYPIEHIYQKAKQVVLEHLLETEPAFKIEYTKFGNPKPESYDRADAIIIAKAGDSIEST